jgi:DNA-binding NarL/FixJ family response regulator
LHARAAQLVENESAVLRHKVAAACGPDPELAAEVAVLAGRQAAAGSWAAAADSLLAAATLAATTAERERSALTAMDCLQLAGNEAEAATLSNELATVAERAPQGYGQAWPPGAAGRNHTALTRTDPTASLTRQEQAVARLVAAGHTNRETAAALVVSVKTIEYHLGNTYAKLGVTSRTQLALALREYTGNP